jgi:hypothetical protein
MRLSAAPETGEHHHWVVRGVLLAGLVMLIVGLRVLLGSHSLRDSDIPQRVALVDSEPTPPSAPPPLAQPEDRKAPPEDESRSDGLDVRVPTTDAGLGPTSTQLAVDADAQAGFDSFGLGAKRGGRDLALDLGKPERASGGGGSAGFTNYAAQLGTYLDAWLNRDEDLRRSNYALHARIWLDASGAVERCILIGTTGDAALDQQLVARLSAARPPNGPPPSDLPQPINLLIRSRINAS